MNAISRHSLFVFGVVVLGVIFTVLSANLAFIWFNGTRVPVPDIPRDRTTIGEGEQLIYLVLGDSTSISQVVDTKTIMS